MHTLHTHKDPSPGSTGRSSMKQACQHPRLTYYPSENKAGTGWEDFPHQGGCSLKVPRCGLNNSQASCTPFSLHVVQTAPTHSGLTLNPQITSSNCLCMAWRQHHTHRAGEAAAHYLASSLPLGYESPLEMGLYSQRVNQ